jgi:hypothetical protein
LHAAAHADLAGLLVRVGLLLLPPAGVRATQALGIGVRGCQVFIGGWLRPKPKLREIAPLQGLVTRNLGGGAQEG